MEKRKICCFCESWESGGIESFLSNMLGNMELENLSLDIVASVLRPSVFRRGLEEKGVRFIELSGSMRKVLKNRRLFKALLKKEKYHAVHFNLFQALSLNYVSLAKKQGVKRCIVHSHNTALRKSLLRPLKLGVHYVSRALWRKSVGVRWACSEKAAEFLFGKEDFSFVPNGIDTARFAFDVSARESVRSELGIKDKFVAGCVGRLTYQKNQSFAIDVLASIAKLRTDAVLLLVGEGEDERALKEKARALGIGDRVIFCGVSSAVERFYSAMDVLLFPSLFEGLGIVAIEAQASGLSVLCSENIPPEALVTDKARTVPLALGAVAWAKECANVKGNEREKYSSLVKAAGFDGAQTAKMIEKAYLGA